MGVNITTRKAAKGKESLYLDVNHRGNRERINLRKFIFTNPKNEPERQHNRFAKDFAESQRSKKALQLLHNETKDVRLKLDTRVSEYGEEFVASIGNTAVSKAINMLRHLERFSPGLTFKQLRENKVTDFATYLRTELKGEGARAYWFKFRKMMIRARADRYTDFDIRDLPKQDTRFPASNDTLTKDTLTEEEIALLAKTTCEDNRVKYGFLFMYFAGGLAFTDLYHLETKHIREHSLAKPRQKTQRWVWNDLHPVCVEILKKAPKGEAPFMFDLPNRDEYGACYDRFYLVLKRWVKAAGISKHITPHCARHSLGTNIEADPRTLAAILGHSPKTGFAMTFKYQHARDDRKKEAIGKLKSVKL